MTSFTSQGGWSTLASSLASFPAALEIGAASTADDRCSQASAFLEKQKTRAEVIEQAVLKSAGCVLPESKDAKTSAELIELVQSVQEITRNQLATLQARLEMTGAKNTWQRSIRSPYLSRMPQGTDFGGRDSSARSVGFSHVGGPLTPLTEGDIETDGMTTPGSIMHPSPFLSAKRSARKLQSTPSTPTLDSFSFSVGTAAYLNDRNTPGIGAHQDDIGDKSTPLQDRTRSTKSPGHKLVFDDFHEDDDMITLGSSVAPPSTSVSFHTVGTPSKEKFLNKMERIMERVEESIHESRPSDEISRNRKVPPSRPGNSRFLDEVSTTNGAEDDLDDKTDFDEDSTNVVATQLRTEPPRLVQVGGSYNPEDRSTSMRRPTPVVFHKPSHIVIETDMPSPTHTNITMDNTALNDTYTSAMMDDNLSTATPILDRYRIDRDDDNSIGIKVVPNKRGFRTVAAIPETIKEVRTPARLEFVIDEEGIRSPTGIPSSVCARKKTLYRKTPYPKKKLEKNAIVDDDENRHPNRGQSARNFGESVSIPPLKPTTLGLREVDPAPHAEQQPSTVRVPCGSPRRALVSIVDLKPAARLNLQRITSLEYKEAPRIVQMQVTQSEANSALEAVEERYLNSPTYCEGGEFTESEGYDILSNDEWSRHKKKSILMSLCHWRRMIMSRDESVNSLTFALVLSTDGQHNMTPIHGNQKLAPYIRK